MRRRNLIITIDSDEDDGESTATTSASVASVGGGSGGRPSPASSSPLPIPFPSLSLSPSAPVVISDDDDDEEDVEEILDPDGDSAFVDAPEGIPPSALAPGSAQATPPSAAGTPTQTPTPAPAPTPSPSADPCSNSPPAALNGPLRPVDEFLRTLGLRLRPEWLESCAVGLPGFDVLGGAEARARRCFEQFLFADMNTCGAGVLPEGVGSMHAVVLDGPFVLQVDEIINISAPLREGYRGTSAGPKRCLKLSMTDGIQRIFGMEYRPIKDLEVLAPAGLKVVVRNVHVKRGLLLLVPEVIEILGGVFDDLEAARDRLVSEVNKPPRGKRKQGGLPLSLRATLAARPCGTTVTNGGEQGIPLPATVNSYHPTGLGNASQFVRTTEALAAELVSHPVMANVIQEQSQHVQEINMKDLSTSSNNAGTSASIPHEHIRQEYVDPSIMANNSHEQVQRVQEVNMQEQSIAFVGIERQSSTSTPCEYGSNHGSHLVGSIGANDMEAARSSSRLVQEINMQDLSTSWNNTGTAMSDPNGHDRTHAIQEEYVDPSIMTNNGHEQVQCAQDVTMQEQAIAFVRTEGRASTSSPCEYDSHHGSHAIGGTGANNVEPARTSNLDDEINHMEHSIILSGENEKPFTYIISMLQDWGNIQAFIQGKIKGLITSVKSFQYRRRSEYELYVYIDDGSYISTAFVDHNIVKNMIGLSPEEVTSALSGKSTLASTSEMKGTLKGFERFLVKFEGMMLIEFNKNSSIPIVRELNEGCSSSDAWLVLARLKTFSSRRCMQNLDDMDTTP